MYNKTATLWTFQEGLESKIIDEAFSLNCEGKFSYKMEGKSIQNVLLDGWKMYQPPIREGKFFVWWLFKE